MAFTSLNVGAKNPKIGGYSGNQKFQKNWKSKGNKWDNKSNFTPKQNVIHDGNKIACKHCDKLHNGKCWFEGKPKCTGCGNFGHIFRDCNGNKGTQKVNYANLLKEIGSLYYACNVVIDVKVNHFWYIANDCSNHMTEDGTLLVNI